MYCEENRRIIVFKRYGKMQNLLEQKKILLYEI